MSIPKAKKLFRVPDSVPDRLSIAMERLGLTVAQIVHALNKEREAKGEELIGDAGVRYWKRGDRAPSIADIQRLANILECDPGWLAFGSGSSASPPKWLELGTTQTKPKGAMVETALRSQRAKEQKQAKGREGRA